jgi:regulatory protein
MLSYIRTYMVRKDSSAQPGDEPVFGEVLKKAAQLCSRQEQCTGNIREKLSEWQVREDDAEKIIGILKKEKFLDDHRFAVAFVRDKFRFNHWGRLKISYMLRMKGIPDETIREAVSRIDEEEYRSVCRGLIRTRSDGMKESNNWTRKGKLYRFATGRGFEPELVNLLLDTFAED